MGRRPSNAELAEDDARAVARQGQLRLAADWTAEALSRRAWVQRVALIGSVAGPLWREIPPYRRSGPPTVHTCKDVDLAVWVSDLDRLAELRRDRIAASRRLLSEAGFGIPPQDIELFPFEPVTDRHLGRVCQFKACPAAKPACAAPGCGDRPFQRQFPAFELWPDTLHPAHSVVLFDRASGVVARAADLPTTVVNRVPEATITVTVPAHRRSELMALVRRWNDEA